MRDNQRRSRARRDELLHDLQQRLDEHERHGVQATVEMQQAARHAARENERLRALLRRKGVSDAEVEESLRLADPDPVDDKLVRNRRKGRASTAPRTPRLSSVAASLNVGQPETPAGSYPPRPLSGSSPGSTGGFSPLLEPPVMPREDHKPTSFAHWPGSSETTPSHLADPDVGRKSGTETSCDVAAAILASMQGHGDTGRARVVLGCTGPSSCTVKNTRVFDLLDEAA
jgi:hypothetical protein